MLKFKFSKMNEIPKEVNTWTKKYYKTLITLYRSEFDHKLNLTFRNMNIKLSTVTFILYALNEKKIS